VVHALLLRPRVASDAAADGKEGRKMDGRHEASTGRSTGVRGLLRRIVPAPAALVFAVLVASGAATGCGERDRAAGRAPDTTETADVGKVVERGVAAVVPPADRFGVETFRVVFELEGQETGRRTMWVEDHGSRVGIEEELTGYGGPQRKLYYWDGARSHMQDLPDGEVYTTTIRTKVSEPTAFATTSAADLERVGYERLGEKTVAGKTCEHWKNARFNYEGCRWNGIELEFLNGAGTDKILQRTVAVEFVEGEGIPDRVKAIAG
jgi:hypothetical protein